VATKRTIQPVEEAPVMEKIRFEGAKMSQFGREDKAAAWVVFHCSLGAVDSRGFQGLFKRMGWSVPGEKVSMEKLDGSLSGGHFILTSQNKLVDAEVEIAFGKMGGFSVHRFELEGKKKKGFRRELRFKSTFELEDGCALLESYMMRSDNARGTLQVTYLKEPVQTTIDDSAQLSIPDVEATEEQKAAAREIN
jgi:hypothetical protein